MLKTCLCISILTGLVSSTAFAASGGHAVSDEMIVKQRQALAIATDGKGYGPQSPRDITVTTGANTRVFGTAPNVRKMTLCDIHFHENAEHKGGFLQPMPEMVTGMAMAPDLNMTVN